MQLETIRASAKKMCIITDYQNQNNKFPLFIQGDALNILQSMPDNSIDCCITSPPYWQKRQYENGGIGLEDSYHEYINNLFSIIKEIKRVLKSSGAFWLNVGDSYCNKSLVGIPWRIALMMIDDGWILRNNIIWSKHKGGMNPNKDRFGSVFEDFFFFVKNEKYYFDADSIRSKPRHATVKNGAVVSATGVSGIRYRRQIELSTSLSDEEKAEAKKSLDKVLENVKLGIISDFRMVIRNEQRTTHSDSTRLSGRAKELKEKGFYFLFYNPKGTMPGDVWDIIPEDSQQRKKHFAPYPEELCVIPIKSTCPCDGVVLDPFSGTGTTMKVAFQLGRKSIGIDLSNEYIKLAKERICREFQNYSLFQ